MGRPKLIKRFNKVVDNDQGKIGGSGHYQATYINHENFKPTQMIKPPIKARPVYGPMLTQPTSKDVFINHGIPIKRLMIMPREEMEMNEGKVDGTTMYKQDFPIKQVLPPMPVKKPEENIVRTTGTFDGTTMNKSHYKEWAVQQRPRYKELQSISGQLIFPGKKLFSDKSTTHATHASLPMDRFTKSEIKIHPDNIQVGEGNMDLTTTTNLAYQPNHNWDRQLVKAPHMKYKYMTPPKMDCKTKYNFDFGGKSNKYIPPLKAASPAPTTINIKMDNHKCGYETEQRNQFHGWNATEHPRVKGIKLQDNTQLATGSMQTLTSNMQDYPVRVIDVVKMIKRPNTKQEMKITKNTDKTDYITSNKASYTEWKNVSRERYGDFHEAHKQAFIYYDQKNQAPYQTTAQSEFIKRKYTPRQSMKPTHKMSIDTSLTHDFNTTSRLCFQHPPRTAYEIEEIEVIC